MSFKKAILIAVAIFCVRGIALAKPVSSVRILPNRITAKYLLADALHRTYRLEESGNLQRAAIDARYGFRRSTKPRPRLAVPVVISEGATTYMSRHGRRLAYKIVVLGSTSIHGVSITSLYSYIYARQTGLLLQYDSVPASAALARAHGFPINPFLK
ncbi:MAG: hypothetical protein HKL92_10440 [Candidatus Eremiobacteraeota bacterium]|nr:hypothetical protein [Candidatus Eremiobacteraeota bacterium]NNM93748.1 hypothetical protein [Candidatus Eremiobacteraeota bacterium]